MATYELSITPTLLNEVLSLPKQVSKRISNKLEVLREDPISARGRCQKLE